MDGGERDPDGNGSVAEVTRSQPVLTPLTESAILLVLTVETGGVDAMRSVGRFRWHRSFGRIP